MKPKKRTVVLGLLILAAAIIVLIVPALTNKERPPNWVRAALQYQLHLYDDNENVIATSRPEHTTILHWVQYETQHGTAGGCTVCARFPMHDAWVLVSLTGRPADGRWKWDYGEIVGYESWTRVVFDHAPTSREIRAFIGPDEFSGKPGNFTDCGVNTRGWRDLTNEEPPAYPKGTAAQCAVNKWLIKVGAREPIP